MPSIGPGELIVVLVIALLILGPKRLPDAGRSVGRGMREFKEAITGGGADDEPALRRAPAVGEPDVASQSTTASNPAGGSAA
jgi:sec-independent protein translocase protein TatA